MLSVEGNKEKAGTLSKSESVHDRPSTCRSPQSRAFGEMADGKNGDLFLFTSESVGEGHPGEQLTNINIDLYKIIAGQIIVC